MLWMREARIRSLTQLELEACQEEIVWRIKCHNSQSPAGGVPGEAFVYTSELH